MNQKRSAVENILKGENMRKRIPGSTIFLTVMVLLLAAAAALTWYVTNNYVVWGLQLFPKNADSLDIRDTSLSLNEYDSLSRILARTDIIWNVPYSGGTVSSDASTLTVTSLTGEDLDALALLTNLETLHAEDCKDYPVLLEAYNRFPDVTILYTVPIAGQRIPCDSRSIAVSTLSQDDLAMLDYLPELTAIDASACQDFDTLLALRDSHPQWDIRLTDTVAGIKLDRDASDFEVTGAGYEELRVGIRYMHSLRTLTLHDPDMTGEQLQLLCEENPGITIHWDATIGGHTFTDDAKEIDLSDMPLSDLTGIRAFADKFPLLEKLILEKGMVTDEDMYSYRLEVGDRYRVVWTVVFSDRCSARTDQDWFMPTKVHEYYFNDDMAAKLMYMEDVVSMDLGHHPIRNTDFLKYMPKLEYLVLTDTQIRAVTNIEYCTELKFFEMDWVPACTSLGHIDQCTKLEDLSINEIYESPEVICRMTWLKHLRWRYRGSSIASVITALPDTIIYLDFYNPNSLLWRRLPNYYTHRDILGMGYMGDT